VSFRRRLLAAATAPGAGWQPTPSTRARAKGGDARDDATATMSRRLAHRNAMTLTCATTNDV
jgi:hypothetical protein